MGAAVFYELSRRLKLAAPELRKELHKGVRTAAKPLVPAVRASARRSFPNRGGLATAMARKPYRTQSRTGAATAGVRIVGSKVDPRINSDGRVQHPVFGTGRRVVQNVPSARGYFDRPITEGAPAVREELIRTLQEFVQRRLTETIRG